MGDVTGQVKPGGGDRWGEGWLAGGRRGASPHPGEVELSTLMGRAAEMPEQEERVHMPPWEDVDLMEAPAPGRWKARFKKERLVPSDAWHLPRAFFPVVSRECPVSLRLSTLTAGLRNMRKGVRATALKWSAPEGLAESIQTLKARPRKLLVLGWQCPPWLLRQPRVQTAVPAQVKVKHTQVKLG